MLSKMIIMIEQNTILLIAIDYVICLAIPQID